MAYDLYSLLPSLKACESIDTTDTRYLNQSHTPMKNGLTIPLKRLFHHFFYKYRTLKVLSASVSPFSFIDEFYHDTNTCPPLPLVEVVDFILYHHLLPLLHCIISRKN